MAQALNGIDLPRTFGSGRSSVLVHYGTDGAPEDAPLIIGAEAGISCLSFEIRQWSSPLGTLVLRLADAMREAEDGMWLAFVDVPGERRLALVQSNRGFGDASFYRRHHGVAHDTGHSAWHDYYCRAGYHLLDEIETNWQAPAIEVSHPTGFGWRPDVAPALLDGIRHWLSEQADDRPATRELFFRDGDPCEMRDSQALAAALDRIEGESRTEWTPVVAERADPARFGCGGLSDTTRILRVDVVSKSD